MNRNPAAIIERDGNAYVAPCPEYDIVGQGESIGAACPNLREALEGFFECASAEEVERRRSGEVYVAPLEVAPGSARDPVGTRGPRDPGASRIRRSPAAWQSYCHAAAG